MNLEFLDDNVHCRQLDTLSPARIALRRRELANPHDSDRLRPEGEVRDQVGRMIAMSGRCLDRYLSVQKRPVPLQRVFQEGRLPLAIAARIAGLPEGEIAEIARRVEAGATPGEAARVVLPASAWKGTRKKSIAARIEDLHAILRGLDSDLCQETARLPADQRRRLEEVGAILASILERCTASRNRPTSGPGE